VTVLAVDTDVLVSWAVAGADRHAAARTLLEREIARRGQRLGITAQVIYELIHVVTDRRRFSEPLTMEEALDLAEGLWIAPETERISAPPMVLARATELLRRQGLGRKRILDTALAATLENAGVGRLATWNTRDFELFDFLELVGAGAD
jgi:predicted nucleic acid-binding protein